MGLDMYLEKINIKAIKYMNNDVDETKKSDPTLYSEMKPYVVMQGSDLYKWESFFEQIGYWRKANHIHDWFVENCQNGDDDCGYHEVAREQLEDLLAICQEVLSKSVLIIAKIKNGYTFDEKGKKKYNIVSGRKVLNPEVAERLLPTQEGFFFGATDYDECYIEDIHETVSILQKALTETDFSTHAVYYSASW